MENDDTAIWIEAARGGDPEAFGVLAERYRRLLFSFFRQAGFPAADIEDLTQEALLRAYRELPRLRRPERFVFWLAGIARNIARERRREFRRRLRFASHAEPSSPAPSATDREEETIADLSRAVARLPLRYRVPLTLHFLEGRDCRHVAAQLGLTESAVKVRIHRAKERLRRMRKR